MPTVWSGLAVVGADDDLEAPGGVSPAQLGVADEGAALAVAGHEAGEAHAPAVDEVEPLVLAQRTMSVGLVDLVQKLRHLGDVVLAHAAFDLDGVHHRRLPVASPGLARDIHR